jgi:transposase InsO family protein
MARFEVKQARKLNLTSCSGAEAIADAFDYIETFYNRRRRHFTLNYASPQGHCTRPS